MNKLEAIVKDVIKEQGEITFKEFMELALYYPELGYYTSNRPKIGRAGDFYTSPDVGEIFGQLLGKQISEIWNSLGCPCPFYLVEFGAGKGLLARDILFAIKKQAPELFKNLVYGIVEISLSLRKTQKEVLAAAGLPLNQVNWVRQMADLNSEPIVGCVLSNELVDAFPVHLVQRTAAGIREAMIMLNSHGDFVQEFSRPISSEIEEFLQVAEINLSQGQIIEVNMTGIKWLAEVEQALQKGVVLTIDYGYLSPELAAPHRFDGTLLCYEKHQVKENPYENVGLRDITAHVNFTSLINYGEKFGLTKLEYTTQGKFLLKLGILDLLEQQLPQGFNLELFKRNQKIKQLIMPGGLGDTFKVLIQSKRHI